MVDLPAPLGPRNPKISPRPTEKSMPRTAGSRDFGYVKVSPRTRITSVAMIGHLSTSEIEFRPDFPERRGTILISEITEDSEDGVAAVTNPDNAAEQLALVLTNHGLQRMTARVLATLLFTEQPTMTMGELADQLQASSGAISGAIKMLTSVGLVERVPAPASRRDHYRLRDDAWAVLYTNQNEVLAAMQKPPRPGSRQRLRKPRS